MRSDLCVLFLILSLFYSNALLLPGCYIHIPFCRRRCYYCDFPIQVIGDSKAAQFDKISAYVDVLTTEMSSTFSQYQEKQSAALGETNSLNFDTVYFGGGTPSLLSPIHLEKILSTIEKHSPDYDPSRIEITMEMDPGTFDMNKLKAYKSAGVNRVSLGVQSFDDNVLNQCGRAHRSSDVYNAFELLNRVGIDNFSIDLISSLPGLSFDLWIDTLHKTRESDCKHVSVYDLQVEEKTAFGRWYTPGEFPLPTDEESAAMYSKAVEILTKVSASQDREAFEHYEVSNYAKKGFRSRHNQKYWRRNPTFGFGMGAASFLDNVRQSRSPDMQSYVNYVSQVKEIGYQYALALQSVNNIDIDGDGGKSGDDHKSEKDDCLEGIMLALRTADGLNLRQIDHNYGVKTKNKVLKGVSEYIQRGIVLHNSDNDVLRMKDPEGFLISNDIIASVFAQFL